MTTVFDALRHGAQTNAIQLIILFVIAVIAEKRDKSKDVYSLGIGWSLFWILVWVAAMIIDITVRALWD